MRFVSSDGVVTEKGTCDYWTKCGCGQSYEAGEECYNPDCQFKGKTTEDNKQSLTKKDKQT